LIEVPDIRCVAGRGIEGDRFFDFKENYAGQITFFSSEVFDELCFSLRVRGKSPGAAGRNVVTAGVDLNSLIGQEFEVQGVHFAGVAECHPCYWTLRLLQARRSFLAGRGGLRARILTDGILIANS
jgi:MOSC domain-containing protein YiiM